MVQAIGRADVDRTGALGRRSFGLRVAGGLVGLLGGMCIAPAPAIEPNATEIELARQIREHPRQERTEMVYDPALNVLARAKALDMARRRYSTHTDPDGYGPNRLARLVGYRLPTGWGDAKSQNNIESLGAGYTSVSALVSAWANSEGHRWQVFAEHEFWANHTRYGVGYANVPGSQYGTYYVFVSAPAPPAGEPSPHPYAEWLLLTHRHTTKRIEEEGDLGDRDRDGIPRITEFALRFDPGERNRMPAPVLDQSRSRLVWDLPLRSDLGSIEAVVEASAAFGAWTTEGVGVEDGAFVLPIVNGQGFLRLNVSR